MIRALTLLLFLSLCLCGVACGTGDTDPTMDVGGAFGKDIPAKEIKEFTPVEKSYCVGRQRQEQFAEYDGDCQSAIGKGECVQMPNPHEGGAFYCSLCGLKGANMICFMISPE